jgi:hypothetical protein
MNFKDEKVFLQRLGDLSYAKTFLEDAFRDAKRQLKTDFEEFLSYIKEPLEAAIEDAHEWRYDRYEVDEEDEGILAATVYYDSADQNCVRTYYFEVDTIDPLTFKKWNGGW